MRPVLSNQQPEPGQLLDDRYEVLDILGHGGAGCVYRVRDTNTSDIRALKWLTHSGEIGVRRFRREFLSTSRLDHPHIVRVYDVSESSLGQYYTMEYVDGEVLDVWLGRADDLNCPERMKRLHQALAQTLDALRYIHGQQIVHRDIKPANVMVDRQGRVRLMDFGLALERTLSWVGVTGDRVVGTLSYMSPEQLDQREVDARSDLYSLGVVLYELLTGRLPFDAGHAAAVITSILHDVPSPPNAFNPGVNPFLASVALALLSKDPAHRPQSADELLEVLRQGQLPDEDSAVSDELLADAADPPPAEGGGALYRSRLAGRDRELKLLREAMSSAAKGDGSVLLFSGDAGLGRTRLMEELEVMARRARAWVLIAQGRPRADPYASVRLAFEEVAMRLAREPRISVDQDLLCTAGRALVELSPRFGELAALQRLPEPTWATEENWLFQVGTAASLLVRALALLAPVVFIGEDLHHWDTASLHVFGQLVHTARSLPKAASPLLVVGTATEWEPEGDRTRRRLLRGIKNCAPNVALPPLDLAGVALMVASMLGRIGRLEGVGEWIFEHTGGNPYLVAETLKMLVADGFFVRQRGDWQLNWDRLGSRPRPLACREDLDRVPLPLGVRDLMARRVARLGPRERRVVEAAAVIGRDVEFDILRAAVDMDEDELLETIDALFKVRIFGDLRGRDDMCSFEQEKVRELLIASLAGPARRELHGRIADAVERHSVAPDKQVVRLAHLHAEAGNVDKALELLPAAGERLEAMYLNEDALQAYDRFVILVRELTAERRAACGEALLDVRRRQTRLLRAAGRYQEALEIFEELIAEIASTGRHDVASELLIGVANIQEHLGRYEVSAQLARRARALARAAGARGLEASALQSLGAIHANRGEISEALELHTQALLIMNELGEARGTANALNSIANLRFNLGELDAALSNHKQALEVRRGQNDHAGLASSLNNIGNISLMKGRFDQALEFHRESLSIRRRIGHRKGIAFNHANIGAVFVVLGDSTAARDHLEQSLALSRDIGDSKLELVALINLGLISVAQGELSEAQESVRRAQEVSARMGHVILRSSIDLVLSRIAETSGDSQEAVARAESAISAAQQVRDLHAEAEATLRVAELSHPDSEALQHAERALELARVVDNDYMTLQAVHRVGVLECRTSRREQGREHLEEAARILARLTSHTGSWRELFLNSPPMRAIARDLEEWLQLQHTASTGT